MGYFKDRKTRENLRCFLRAWAVILLLMLAGEVALRWLSGFYPLSSDLRQYVYYPLIALGFVLMPSRRMMAWSLLPFALLEAFWFGYFSYFGDVVNPAMLMLGTKQAFEIGIAMTSELHLILPAVLAVVVFNLLLFLALDKLRRKRFVRQGQTALVVLLLPLVVITGRAFLHKRIYVIQPVPYNMSHAGVLQALALTLRFATHDLDFDLDKIASTVLAKTNALPVDRPISVVVIMGESIAPLHLDVGAGLKHSITPLLARRLAGKSGKSVLFKNVGFSQAISTHGSVPQFMRMAYHPVGAYYKPQTLFDIAAQNGFSTGYYTAQSATMIQVAGQKNVDQIESVEQWHKRFEKKKDGVIIDQMKASPLTGKRRFYFIQQRTNHAPYDCDLPLAKKIDGAGQNRRLRRYRHGLVCYDESLDALLTFFENRPGDLYVFMTSDHNELTGQNGKWGHGSLDLQTALVPYFIATNRPDSELVKSFSRMRLPTAFEFTGLVTKALGWQLSLDRPVKNFYVNGPTAFGRQGFMQVERTGKIDEYLVTDYTSLGRNGPRKRVKLLGIKEKLLPMYGVKKLASGQDKKPFMKAATTAHSSIAR